MFKFLALLFVFGFLGFLLFGVFLGRVIRFFNPSSKKNTASARRKTTNNRTTQNETPRKKFRKNEGEYIDYEEIKDE